MIKNQYILMGLSIFCIVLGALNLYQWQDQHFLKQEKEKLDQRLLLHEEEEKKEKTFKKMALQKNRKIVKKNV